jgi:hypothetical protein
VTGYLFAHALFIDSGPLARRLARLWPYAALSTAWLAAYKALGYGTTGGGMYLNPLDEPLPYLRALAERLPVLLAAQGGGTLGPWSPPAVGESQVRPSVSPRDLPRRTDASAKR